MDQDKLIKAALEISKNAYAPYSNFQVGAIVVTQNGKMFKGVNLENSSYGLTICAERAAISAAVTEGEYDFHTLIVVSSSSPPAPPCGACRQVLYEFSPSLKVIMANDQGEVSKISLKDLLPRAFNASTLRK